MARVLVVDDSLLQRKIIGGILKAEGHEVIEALDGQDGLEKATSEKPDCILSDLVMPKMDGFAFLAELKRSGLNIPTIVATSDIQEDARQECLDLGALHVIHKPIKKEDILNALSRMLQPCQGKSK